MAFMLILKEKGVFLSFILQILFIISDTLYPIDLSIQMVSFVFGLKDIL